MSTPTLAYSQSCVTVIIPKTIDDTAPSTRISTVARGIRYVEGDGASIL